MTGGKGQRLNDPFLLSFSVHGTILQQLFAWIDDFGFFITCDTYSTERGGANIANSKHNLVVSTRNLCEAGVFGARKFNQYREYSRIEFRPIMDTASSNRNIQYREYSRIEFRPIMDTASSNRNIQYRGNLVFGTVALMSALFLAVRFFSLQLFSLKHFLQYDTVPSVVQRNYLCEVRAIGQ